MPVRKKTKSKSKFKFKSTKRKKTKKNKRKAYKKKKFFIGGSEAEREKEKKIFLKKYLDKFYDECLLFHECKLNNNNEQIKNQILSDLKELLDKIYKENDNSQNLEELIENFIRINLFKKKYYNFCSYTFDQYYKVIHFNLKYNNDTVQATMNPTFDLYVVCETDLLKSIKDYETYNNEIKQTTRLSQKKKYFKTLIIEFLSNLEGTLKLKKYNETNQDTIKMIEGHLTGLLIKFNETYSLFDISREGEFEIIIDITHNTRLKIIEYFASNNQTHNYELKKKDFFVDKEFFELNKTYRVYVVETPATAEVNRYW